ncbi:MAG: DNA-processing protein DprA [Polyangiaceae bacterium]
MNLSANERAVVISTCGLSIGEGIQGSNARKSARTNLVFSARRGQARLPVSRKSARGTQLPRGSHRWGCMDQPTRREGAALPAALRDLTRPCPTLLTRGRWPAPVGIAIVGTRKPTREALDFTRRLAERVVKAGWAVWSGGAVGIDAGAHAAAMEHKGITVVVLPSGFKHMYPKENRELFERVVEKGGTLISPFEEEAQPALGYFHHRNAVLAAATFATVVVQAGEKSGARSTARAARRLRRPLFVVPHAPWDEAGMGCALELANGARVLVKEEELVEKLTSVRDEAQLAMPLDLGAPAREGSGRGVRSARTRASHARADHARACDVPAGDRARVPRAALDLDPEAKRVLAAIGETPRHTDDLCERTALPAGAVAAALLTLTLQAVVVEAPAGFYRLRAP